jgi:hypothetical protein
MSVDSGGVQAFFVFCTYLTKNKTQNYILELNID